MFVQQMGVWRLSQLQLGLKVDHRLKVDLGLKADLGLKMSLVLQAQAVTLE